MARPRRLHENSEDSKLRHLAFMALAANTLKPGSSMAESRIRRFQDQALRALASQVAEADGSGNGGDNLQRLAFVALASQVLKPGAADTESRTRQFHDQALLAPDSQLSSADVSNTHDQYSQYRNSYYQLPEALADESETEESGDASSSEPTEDCAIICANCEGPGHEVSECMIPRLDGYVHGCAFCNTTSHGTTECSKYSWDFESQVDVLVRQRGSMPPLKDAPWRLRPMMVWYYLVKLHHDGGPCICGMGLTVLRGTRPPSL
ncbi:hypothetical protein CEP52_010232 [Fusarium oligoseptatum]|uniref:CCHC-type domain-containing protein n=1 Tax=Fusarium oligoseptatum TaxID=2604345 RepID=A0A428T9H5_9HYPO|nr:hypothetical protein CEP52_010232 [Fusarium oligoseptatum]